VPAPWRQQSSARRLARRTPEDAWLESTACVAARGRRTRRSRRLLRTTATLSPWRVDVCVWAVVLERLVRERRESSLVSAFLITFIYIRPCPCDVRMRSSGMGIASTSSSVGVLAQHDYKREPVEEGTIRLVLGESTAMQHESPDSTAPQKCTQCLRSPHTGAPAALRDEVDTLAGRTRGRP
jgi:hypothetical protein